MRRLAIIAVAMIGAALLVSTAFAQAQSQIREGDTDKNHQGIKIAGIKIVGTDTIGVIVRVDENGNAKVVDGDPPLTIIVPSGIDGVTLVPGGVSNASTLDCADLSAYSQVTALISWTIAAADSDSIMVPVWLYNKESNNFGTNDSQVFPKHSRSTVSTDTLLVQPNLAMAGVAGIVKRPSLYVYRSTSSGALIVQGGAVKTTLNGLGALDRVFAGNGAVSINLTDLFGPLNYVGVVAGNWHPNDSMTNFKVVYLCRK